MLVDEVEAGSLLAQLASKGGAFVAWRDIPYLFGLVGKGVVVIIIVVVVVPKQSL